jgi:hypothetical protein
MSRKRTSLDAIVSRSVAQAQPEQPSTPVAESNSAGAKRPGIKQQTAYLPLAVHEQLRSLAFEERGKMHDYLLEGLDLVFRKRGLPGIEELKKKAAS